MAPGDATRYFRTIARGTTGAQQGTFMNIGHVRTAQVIVTTADRPLAEAARSMRQRCVGALVVVDAQDPKLRPTGILTDRDIVRGQLSKAADLHCLTVGDVMSRDPLCLEADMSFG